MYFFTTIKNIFVDPKGFFQSKRDENRLGGAFFYGFIMVVISGIIRYGYILLTHGIDKLLIDKNVMRVSDMTGIDANHLTILSVIIIEIGTFIGLLLVPLFIHLGMRIMKGSGNLRKTYQAVIFGSTPYLLLGVIPVIGYLAMVYGLYIKVVGLAEFHTLRFDYSIVGYVIGRIIGFFIMLIAAMIIGLIFALSIVALVNHNDTLKNYLNDTFSSTTPSTFTHGRGFYIQGTSTLPQASSTTSVKPQAI